jgi:hypothetical protein
VNRFGNEDGCTGTCKVQEIDQIGMDDYQLLAPESVSKFSQNFQNQIAGEIMTSLLASKDHKVGRHMCCYCAFKFRFSQPVTSPFIFISTKPKSPISENSSFS